MPGLNLRAGLERLRITFVICLQSAKEWVLFDLSLFRQVFGAAGYLLAQGYLLFGMRLRGIRTLLHLHRRALAGWLDRLIERDVIEGRRGDSRSSLSPVAKRAIAEYASAGPKDKRGHRVYSNPVDILGPGVTVLKAARGDEKGAILIRYSYLYAPFADLFDLEAILRRYTIVLEPSWCGTCDENILCYEGLSRPVFVQANEPRDIRFLGRLSGGLLPVPIAANWWVDHRLFHPIPGARKDCDLVMVAQWAEFKRHYAFFRALRTLRNQGRRLRAILIGYPSDMDLATVHALARHYGVAGQLECHEWLNPTQVNEHLNRARINIVWSRREGSNRAIIEGFLAGVPGILREGFNYGDRLPYINAKTGRYSDERSLPGVIMSMLARWQGFQPRDWVLENMSCQKATSILNAALAAQAEAAGEPWTAGTVVKTSGLQGVCYWDPHDAERFQADYRFLAGCVRPRASGAAHPATKLA